MQTASPARSAATRCPILGWSCPPMRSAGDCQPPPRPTRSHRAPASQTVVSICQLHRRMETCYQMLLKEFKAAQGVTRRMLLGESSSHLYSRAAFARFSLCGSCMLFVDAHSCRSSGCQHLDPAGHSKCCEAGTWTTDLNCVPERKVGCQL